MLENSAEGRQTGSVGFYAPPNMEPHEMAMRSLSFHRELHGIPC